MLTIKNLNVQVEDKAILKGLDLSVGAGEVHAIMGPNGAGKSTLANTLAGKPGYEVTGGSAVLQGVELNELSPEERAQQGMFLSFQYPVAIPGVNNLVFLKTAVNGLRKERGQEPLDAFDFLEQVKASLKIVGLDESFLHRSLNDGFSGGEKKRNEILQMLLLEPACCVLDETDSGLDVDALQLVAKGINTLRSPDRCFVLITHYHRLLDLVKPDMVHILMDGQLVKSGDASLALEIEKHGYQPYQKQV